MGAFMLYRKSYLRLSIEDSVSKVLELSKHCLLVGLGFANLPLFCWKFPQQNGYHLFNNHTSVHGRVSPPQNQGF